MDQQHIVVLDGFALNPGDLSWDAFEEFGKIEVHKRTPAEQIVGRARDASIILTNKTPLRAPTLEQLPKLRFIGVLATGYDIIDTKAAAEHGILVSNIPTYGTQSVAQFAFALLLELCHHVQRHVDDVRAGGWTRNPDWSYALTPLMELAGKTMGLIGYGRIGRQTGAIAEAFGMRVIVSDPTVPGLSVEDVLREADVVSLHCPLTPDTRGLINRERLALMKPSAFLLNTARGPLIVEQDLADALNAGKLAGAGIDVLPAEPPPADSPLPSAKNCLVTPHIAWSTREARQRLMNLAIENVRSFTAGSPQNIVNRP